MTDSQSRRFEDGLAIGFEYAGMREFYLDHRPNILDSNPTYQVFEVPELLKRSDGRGLKVGRPDRQRLTRLQEEEDTRYKRCLEIETQHPEVLKLTDGHPLSEFHDKMSAKIKELIKKAPE